MLNVPIKHWRDKHVWIIGASSGIGLALAQRLLSAGAYVCISARSQARLDALDFGTPPHCARVDSQASQQGDKYNTFNVFDAPSRLSRVAVDVTDLESLDKAHAHLVGSDDALKTLDLIVYCAGHYRAMQANHFDLQEARKHLEINYLGALNLLFVCLPRLQKKKSGHLSFVSSVAGYSGLPKSLAYGPTKAALTHLAEVLYLDLRPQNIGVSVICPGFVETPLTAQNDFHMPALISSEQAAKEILKGYARGEFEIHFPKRFSRFLKLLRILPYTLYFHLVSKITGL